MHGYVPMFCHVILKLTIIWLNEFVLYKYKGAHLELNYIL